jgi:hypothetical protein
MSHPLKDLKIEEQLQKEIDAGYSVTEFEIDQSIKNIQMLDMHKIEVEEYKKERAEKVEGIAEALAALPLKELTFATLSGKEHVKLLDFADTIMDYIEEVEYRLEHDFCEACGEELWEESEISMGMCLSC